MRFTIDPEISTSLDGAETRFVADARGLVRPCTISRRHWLGYEYLIDLGYATHERIIEHALLYRPPTMRVTFEQQLACSIAAGVLAFNRRLGTWNSYVRGA